MHFFILLSNKLNTPSKLNFDRRVHGLGGFSALPVPGLPGNRGRQLSRQFFNVAQDTLYTHYSKNVAICGPDHFRMWSEQLDLNTSSVRLG